MDLLSVWAWLTVGVVVGGPLALVQDAQCRRHGHQPAPSGRVCRRCRQWTQPPQRTGATPA